MEHRLITGGYEFLPFARSCVAKLKKLGMPYASQQYEVNGVSIKVRITPGHEYIRIEGGLQIISGVVRGGTVETIEAMETSPAYKVLRAFKPTPNAWEHPLGSSPSTPTSSFSDMRKLTRVGSPYDTQYADLSPASYSGVMAKVVAIIMARGLPVKYYYNWGLCHGVVFDSAGKPWLVEISSSNGCIAMRLPVDGGNGNSEVDAEREIISLLGGVPNGKTFPQGDALTASIESGKCIRLSTAEGLTNYFGKSYLDNEIGWSFNNTGSEAQNVCVMTDEDGNVVSYLYKLVISISVSEDGTATGSALMTEVEKGNLTSHALNGSMQWLFALPSGFTVPSKTIGYYEPDEYGEAPLFVCFMDGAFDVVRYQNIVPSIELRVIPPLVEEASPPLEYTTYTGLTGGRWVTGECGSSQPNSRSSSVHAVVIGGSLERIYRQTYYSPRRGFLFVTKGNRDGYGVVPMVDGISLSTSYAVWVDFPYPDGYWGGAIINIEEHTFTKVDDGYGADLGYHAGAEYLAGGSTYITADKIAGLSRMDCTIYSRYSPPVKLANANKAGFHIANATDFRFNVFGPVVQYAFITREYDREYDEYENFTLVHQTKCGVTHLGGDMVAGDSIVLDRKYNFIGYIK